VLQRVDALRESRDQRVTLLDLALQLVSAHLGARQAGRDRGGEESRDAGGSQPS
jgi:hypothetical protein